MSDRIPLGFLEFHAGYHLVDDPEPMYTSLGMSAGEVPLDTQVQANELESAWTTALQPILPTNWEIFGSIVVVGQAVGDTVFVCDEGSALGDPGNQSIPQNSCFLVAKRTTLGGRRGRGRMYIPGVEFRYVLENGMLTPTAQTDLQTAMTALGSNLEALDTVGAGFLFHGSAPFDPTPIISLNGEAQIATQRRRLRP